MLAVPLLPALTAVPPAGAATGHWVGGWAASPQGAFASGVSRKGFTGVTLREVIHMHFGGSAVRVRLSGTFSSTPVRIGHVTVAQTGSGAALVAATLHTATFGGSQAVTISPGQEVTSDPVSLPVTGNANLSVSVYLSSATGPTTWHPLPIETTYISTHGDHAAESGGAAYTSKQPSWFFLDGVDVLTTESARTIVAIGDSITDGYHSTPNANHRWPDFLANLELARPAGSRSAILDEGLSGNRVTYDARCCGVSALARFNRDVLGQTGMTPGTGTVIILEGVNDIGMSQSGSPSTAPHPEVSAQQVINGLHQMAAEARAKGLRVIGATLLPFKNAGYWDAAAEVKRGQINAYIRTSTDFDAVIDFATALADPTDPQRMLGKYDSGDHLHPNDAGYQQMATVAAKVV
jgi:lysophospholipase L1-like esterase